MYCRLIQSTPMINSSVSPLLSAMNRDYNVSNLTVLRFIATHWCDKPEKCLPTEKLSYFK